MSQTAATPPPRLYRAPAPPAHRRPFLRESRLPRIPGLDHGSTEGRRYRTFALALLDRLGVAVPVPEAMVPYLREAGALEVTLHRLGLAAEAASDPREQRALRSELRRVRSQRLMQERVLAALAAEHRPSSEVRATAALQRLTGGA